MILLTGATGATGSASAKLLIEKGVPLRALVRNAEKAQWLNDAGVELVVGDLADKAVVSKALQGVDRALLIAVNEKEQLEQEKQFVNCAVAAGVKHIVKLSSIEAVAGETAPIPYAHWQTEEHIRASGIGWTMIKPNFFMENLFANAGTIATEDAFYLPMGDGKVVMGTVADAAGIIAEALIGDEHMGKSYEITGPESQDFHQIAKQIGEVLGRPIRYINQSSEDYRAVLAGFGINEWRVNAVAILFEEVCKGGLDYTTNTVKELLGREPTTLKQFIEKNRAAFGG
ncbi:MAG: hypothetical protein ACJA0N_001476 [Pseudohongiellaceae bacterium]|jgi:uncharacterized protein YbjT (DUF2867 family)